jgi:hypothetical protein
LRAFRSQKTIGLPVVADVLIVGQFRIAARQCGVEEVIRGFRVHCQNVANGDRTQFPVRPFHVRQIAGDH